MKLVIYPFTIKQNPNTVDTMVFLTIAHLFSYSAVLRLQADPLRFCCMQFWMSD